MLTPRWLSRLTKVVRSSRGGQPTPEPASVQMRLNIFRTLPASSAAPRWLVNTSPVSFQPSPAASRSPAWLADQARSAWTATWGRPRVRRVGPGMRYSVGCGPVLAFRGVGEGRDVAGHEVAGFGVRDGALEREVPHAHRRGGVPGCHGGQRLPHVGRGQVAELPGADDGQDRLEHVLVLG